MNGFIVFSTILFLSYIYGLAAQIELWNYKRRDLSVYGNLLDYFTEMSKLTGHYKLIRLNRYLTSTLNSKERIFSEKERIQFVCENSLLRLMKIGEINSKLFSNEMSILRSAIRSWVKDIESLQKSDEIDTFRDLISFLEFINSKKFEIDFCIRLLDNLKASDGYFGDDKEAFKRKLTLCSSLRDEVENSFSEKIPNYSSILKKSGRNPKDMLETSTSSIHSEILKRTKKVNMQSKIFDLILFLDNNKCKIEKYNALETFLNLNNFIDKDSLKLIDHDGLSSIVIEVQDYLPENTMFVSSPLSKKALVELSTAKKHLSRIQKCSKYESILLPLKKKLIFMMKSAGEAIVSYEKGFNFLRGVSKYVIDLKSIYDRSILSLCTYDIKNYKLNETSSIDLYTSKEQNTQNYKSLLSHSPYNSATFANNNTGLWRPEAISGRRNIKGLPYLPISEQKSKLGEFSEKFSFRDIHRVIHSMNIAAEEYNQTYLYIKNSTDIMVNFLKKLQFTNSIYSDIIESSLSADSNPNSLYSYSYILYLDIKMSLINNSANKNKSITNKVNSNSELKFGGVSPELRDKVRELSEDVVIKIHNIINSLRDTLHKRTQGSGLKNIRARLPTTRKRLNREVLSPLKGIEDHLLNLKKSSEDAIKKMIYIEKQIELIKKSENNMVSPSSTILQLEKYIKPLNLVMKCSTVNDSSDQFESCRDVILQAPSLLKHIHMAIKKNKKAIEDQREVYEKSRTQLDSLVKEWSRHLNWVKEIPKLCDDQLPSINRLDSAARMILG
ncbi:putative secreted protein, signal peptide [Cryptosporidium felis]|nr:putative secreted protein, signal peptide [Cryptosporidium felis]